jgi:hypothetical protein
MLSERDVVQVLVDGDLFALAKAEARCAQLAGVSHIRGRAERLANLEDDQLVGQLGQVAGHLLWYGHLQDYLEQRRAANRDPRRGDGGCDITHSNVDFKTSLIRERDPRNPCYATVRDLLRMHLLVRRAEWHENWVYVRLLVRNLRLLEGVPLSQQDSALVYVMGWASSAHAWEHRDREDDPRFRDVYVRLRADKLLPMPPIRWSRPELSGLTATVDTYRSALREREARGGPYRGVPVGNLLPHLGSVVPLAEATRYAAP